MRILTLLLIAVLLLSVAALAVADPRPLTKSRPEAPQTSVGTKEMVLPSPDAISAAKLASAGDSSPMMVEIEALLAAEKLAVNERRRQITQTTDMDRVVELLREIHQLKANTELEIMRVQLRYAQLAGNQEGVREIEEAIDLMTNPRPDPVPVQRPVRNADPR